MSKKCAQETGKARDGNKVGGGSVSFPCLDCSTACTSSPCRKMRLLLLSTWSHVHSRDQDRQDEVLLFVDHTVHTHDCSPPRELLHWRTIRDRINKGCHKLPFTSSCACVLKSKQLLVLLLSVAIMGNQNSNCCTPIDHVIHRHLHTSSEKSHRKQQDLTSRLRKKDPN